jgi:hypothetical protein
MTTGTPLRLLLFVPNELCKPGFERLGMATELEISYPFYWTIEYEDSLRNYTTTTRYAPGLIPVSHPMGIILFLSTRD